MFCANIFLILGLGVAILLCAGQVQCAGVGGSTAGYLYSIHNDNIMRAELLPYGTGKPTVIVSSKEGGTYKSYVNAGPNALYWFGNNKSNVLCLWALKSQAVGILSCNITNPNINNFNFNLVYSDEYNALYWIGRSILGVENVMYWDFVSNQVKVHNSNEVFDGSPSGLAVTKDAKGRGIVVQMGNIDANGALPGIYIWPYRDPNPNGRLYYTYPTRPSYVRTVEPGPVDVAYAGNNPHCHCTELYFSTVVQEYAPFYPYTNQHALHFRLSKLTLLSPLSGPPLNSTTLVLDWTQGQPLALSVDPINQQLYVIYDTYPETGSSRTIWARVDLSHGLPGTLELLTNQTLSNQLDGTLYARPNSDPFVLTAPTIGSYAPDSGPQTGNTTITVEGSGFYQSGPELSCLFGGVLSVPAQFISSGSVRCVSPPSVLKGTTTLQVSNDGSLYSGSVPFTYV